MVIPPEDLLFLRIGFDLLGCFFIPNEFANWSFYEEFHEELSWNFDVDYIESVDCFQ